MSINNLLNLKKAQIRIFPFHTNDTSFILYNDLPTSYLLSLLIWKLWFNLNQFVFDYVYHTKKYIDKTLINLSDYKEDYFIFYLENYYHSSNYAMWFLSLVLDKIEELETKPHIIIHTIKTPSEEIKKLIEKYDFMLLVVNWDFEEFFYKLFWNNSPIEEISNIYYRDDSWKIYINEKANVVSDLDNYVLPAYASKYYTNFAKSKDYVISMLDEDDETTDKDIYYKRPKEQVIESFRYSSETAVMLTTWRWCKYNCSYCYRWVKYSAIRQISLDTIKKDLDYLSELKYEYVYLYDDCFITTNMDRLEALVDLLSKYDFVYWISVRFEVCSSEVLDKISKLRIEKIQIWLQSISIEGNKETKRWFNKTRFEETLWKLGSLWIKVSLDLIIWLPWEWLKWFLKTFNYAISLNPSGIHVNTLFLNPWTELYKKQKEYWITTDNSKSIASLFHVNTVKSSNDFSEKDVIMAKKYVSYYMKKIKSIDFVLR